MKRLKWAPVLAVLMVLAWVAFAFAQELPILWEDHFNDDDPAALKNVGWLYYGPDDGLKDQIIQQTVLESGDSVLYIKSGDYSVVGVGLVETNGVPEIDTLDDAKTHKLLVANNYSSPNQLTTFRVDFKTITSSFFVANARMVQTDTSETIPDADPTQSPAYVVMISPAEGKVRLAKYPAVEYAALQPDAWTYFGEGDFAFDFDVFYWVKFYLNEGDFKVKVWEGDPEDEPEDWLVEAQDDSPRVEGKFNMFALFGAPPGGDEVYIDDIVVRATSATAVESEPQNVPVSFSLSQNYPNPFNPTTEIAYSLPKAGHVNLTVYNVTGQKVRTLVDARVAAGSHKVTFDGRDDYGRELSTGVYIYRLEANGKVLQKKMTLIK